MRRILVVSYHFPPDAEIGGVRPYQFARHLPEFGFEPWILTVLPEHAESPDASYQPAGIPPERIIRTRVEPTLRDGALWLWRAGVGKAESPRVAGPLAASPGAAASPPAPLRSSARDWAMSWLSFPDARVGWRRPGIEAGNRLLATVPFDVLLSSSPPRVAHMVAARLARRHGVPWIMDLRDPWYMRWGGDNAPWRLQNQLQKLLFRHFARASRLIVANTEPLRAHVERLLQGVGRRVECIPNGFDPSLASSGRRDGAERRFNIGYVGHIMGGRSARDFLRGLSEWIRSRTPEERALVQVRFVGSGFDEAQRLVAAWNLHACVRFENSVSRQAVAELLADQFLLLLLANRQSLQIPGKAYEYLAARRRVLAITEADSATAGLLGAAPGCWVASDAQQVVGILERCWQAYRGGASADVERNEMLAGLTYRRRSEELFRRIEEVVGTGAPGPP